MYEQKNKFRGPFNTFKVYYPIRGILNLVLLAACTNIVDRIWENPDIQCINSGVGFKGKQL